MKKLTVILVLLAAFAWCQTSYGMARVLVYKGTLKASKMVIDVNDTNNYVPLAVQGYWVMTVIYDSGIAAVVDSNSVIYNKKLEWVKVIPDAVIMDPCDPCRIEIMHFTAEDADGSVSFDVTGKGKLTKDSNDPANPKSYVATTMNGTGYISNFDFFTPNKTYSGPFTVTLTLDPKLTFEANSGNHSANETLNGIIDKLTAKGTWANWPYLPPP
ncbi:MAG: hypothetical protein ABSH16_08405 [Sedimentisphaerales bacterium]